MSKSGKKNENRQNELQPENREFEHTGQYLKKLRTEKGLTIKDVSNETRISEVNLNAIEAQNFQSLPADTFTRGFLTLYAKHLGIDPAGIVQQFMSERNSGKTGSKRHKPAGQPGTLLTPKTLAEPSHFSSMTAAVILLIIIVILFTAFCLYTSWNPFSFMMSEKKQSFQSLMMGLEQSYPAKDMESKGHPLPKAFDEAAEDASPGAADQTSANAILEKNSEPPSAGAETNTGDGHPSFIAGGQKPVPAGEPEGAAAVSLMEGLQGRQGDE